jgi:CelD/BcsL family acetyltransferase involved in cellulose biosynthesis
MLPCSTLMPEVKVRVATNISECKLLWNEFSRGKDAFDLWEYRACFYDGTQELHFTIGSVNNKHIFLLPLWKRKNSGYYEWFGGEFFEGNSVMLTDKKYASEMLKSLPLGFWLPYSDLDFKEYFGQAKESESFFLDLAKYNYSLEEYFSVFNKKHRKNLLRDLRMLSQVAPEVVRNDMRDFPRLMELSIKRFSDDSFFAEEEFSSGLKRMLEEAMRREELEMLSIKINGKTEACEAAILCNGTYTVLLGGNNLKISNIGKLMTIEHIKNAMEKRAKIVDFLAEDCGWKEMWHLEKRLFLEIESSFL